MIIHEVVQGSEAWGELRAKYPTASEAPIMLGLSKYQSRNDLLKQKATGVSPDITPSLQAIFDEGHAAEAKARPIAEAIIGSELYPCTATDDSGAYLASFDGIDLMEVVCWEHKLFSRPLSHAINSDEIPDTHWPQLEQQMLVSGAEKTLFMCSDGTAENMAHTWYYSIPERQQQVIDGWAQFSKDLEAYEHKDAVIAPVGRAPDALPALYIEVKGMVTASNLAEFKANAMMVIGGIKTDLATDGDFADAEKTTKWLKGVEDKLKSAKEHALSQTADIDALFKAIDAIQEEARAKRLDLGHQVKKQKENIKAGIVNSGKSLFAEHMASINNTMQFELPIITADFASAIKGKRTIDSIQNAVDTELAQVKIEANRIADVMRINASILDELTEEQKLLFADVSQLVLKDSDDLKAVISSRIFEHKEAERRRQELESHQLKEAEQRRKVSAAKATIEPVIQSPSIETPVDPVPEKQSHNLPAGFDSWWNSIDSRAITNEKQLAAMAFSAGQRSVMASDVA